MRTKKISINDILKNQRINNLYERIQHKIKGLKGGFLKFSKILKMEILSKLVFVLS
jgi:hypothetical protein